MSPLRNEDEGGAKTTNKENITAILEHYFTGFKEEIIDSACNRILEQDFCGDYRQAVLNLFNKADNYNWEMSLLKRQIEDLPFDTPTRRTGHWIPMNEIYMPCICSECRKAELKKSKYCPDCGARMESEGEV